MIILIIIIIYYIIDANHTVFSIIDIIRSYNIQYMNAWFYTRVQTVSI